MHGYPRPGPAFRWSNWWSPMLIDEDVDWKEVLAAEDEAIARAGQVENPPEPLANLVEILTDGPAAPVHPSAEGDRRARGGHDEPAGRV